MRVDVREQGKNAIVGIEFQTLGGGRSFASVSCYSTGAQVDLFLAPEDLRHLKDMIQVFLDSKEDA